LRFEGIKIHKGELGLFQNSVGANLRFDKTSPWKNGQSPVFSQNLWGLFQKPKFWRSPHFYTILRRNATNF
jgi:hypothetical protein